MINCFMLDITKTSRVCCITDRPTTPMSSRCPPFFLTLNILHTMLTLSPFLHQGSFLDFDWSDGDVVFANSTCFDDELMLGLSKSAEKLKAGAIVVTFTKGEEKFVVLFQ